jgi:carbamoyl-phosphate synthase large subunit
MKVNVLITGAGGNLGHFIKEALIHSSLSYRIIGCDWSPNALGLYQADIGYVVPPAKSAEYLDEIIKICQKEDVHIIMAGGMLEMHMLAQNKELIKEMSGAFVVSSAPEDLKRMEDKWELTQSLKRMNYDYPRSTLPNSKDEIESFIQTYKFPFIIKDRFGAGSKGVAVVKNQKDLDYFLTTIPNAILQEYLYPDDEEYTVGVFTNASHQPCASIVMKRDLGLGMTFKAQVLPNSYLGAHCEKIVQNMNCIGPANVQLRVTDRGPVVFEINPRFSSSTSARPLFGYNDVEMSIKEFVLKEPVARPQIKEGRFLRMINDVYISNKDFEKLEQTKKIDNTIR